MFTNDWPGVGPQNFDWDELLPSITTISTGPTVEERRGVYLRGPMTGIPDYNFPAFHAAAKRLRALGMVIKSPAESESDPSGMPDKSKMPKECGGEASKTLAEVRHADYLQLLSCTSIILLEGWQGSNGACSEYEVARLCGMPAYEYVGGSIGITLLEVEND